MMSFDGTNVVYPNKYQFDLSSTTKKHMIFGRGYTRNSKNAKYSIDVEWDELTKEEMLVIWNIFLSQYTDSKVLSYTHTGILPNGKDLGPIDVRLDLEYRKRLRGNNNFKIRGKIHEY